MGLIGTLNSWSPGDVIKSSEFNSNFSDIKTAFNTYAVLTDVAKTISVTHTWSARQQFDGGLDGAIGGTTPAAGAFTTLSASSTLSVTGASTLTGAVGINSAPVTGELLRIGSATRSLYWRADSGGVSMLTGTVQTGAGLYVSGANDEVQVWTGSARKATFSSGGILALGTTVVTSASAGEGVLANAKAWRGVVAAGTSTVPLVQLDSSDMVLVGDADNGVHAKLGGRAAASLAAGAAGMNGVVTIDETNNRLVYYSGGNRYYLTGTAF